MWDLTAGTCTMLENVASIQDQLITPVCSQVKLLETSTGVTLDCSWDQHKSRCFFSQPVVMILFIFLKDQETQALKEHLIDELDYVLVPNEAWNKLVSWYGCLDCQRPIVRKVILLKMFLCFVFFEH